VSKKYRQRARKYLRVIGIANVHLKALYSQARSLEETKSKLHDTINIERSRRRRKPIVAQFSPVPIKSLQESLEFTDEVVNISNKVGNWRKLSFTISSTCVITESEQPLNTVQVSEAN